MLAFVLGGGSSRGALQVGALKALAARGIVPEMVVGCSIGAVNGVALAENVATETLNKLESLYLNSDFGDVFTGGADIISNLFVENGVFNNEGLQTILENQLETRQFSELQIPCYLVATDLESGESKVFGDAPDDCVVEATLASAALLPLYKPHEVDGRSYGDGGMNNTLPIDVAIERGATEIIAFNIMADVMPSEMRNSPQNMFLHSIDLLVRSQIARAVALTTKECDVTVHVIDLKSAEYVPLYEMGKMQMMLQSGYTAMEAAIEAQLSQLIEERGEPKTLANKGYVILNPVSGDGDPELIRAPLRHILSQDRYKIYETNEDDSPTELARQAVADGYGWVAAAGGDGTVSAVADGLAGSDTPLVIIPAGTANGIAQGLGIPNDIEQACELLIAGQSTTMMLDAIKVGDRHFLLQMGVGIEAATMENTPRGFKQVAGAFAYMTTAVREALRWEPHQFTLSVDGQERQIRASEIVIANLADIGVLNLQWNEEIRPNDGIIDIAIIRAESALDYAKVVARLVKGDPAMSEHIEFLKAERKIVLSAESDLPLHGDGEVIDDGLPLHAEVAPAVLRVLVPATE